MAALLCSVGRSFRPDRSLTIHPLASARPSASRKRAPFAQRLVDALATFASFDPVRKNAKVVGRFAAFSHKKSRETPSETLPNERDRSRLLRHVNRGPPARTQKQNSLARGEVKTPLLTPQRAGSSRPQRPDTEGLTECATSCRRHAARSFSTAASHERVQASRPSSRIPRSRAVPRHIALWIRRLSMPCFAINWRCSSSGFTPSAAKRR
jgi:hypothetical protein